MQKFLHIKKRHAIIIIYFFNLICTGSCHVILQTIFNAQGTNYVDDCLGISLPGQLA